MKNLKTIPTFLLLLILLMGSCNNQPKAPENTATTPTPDKKPVIVEKLNPENEKLVAHFKQGGNFPIMVDSAFMSKVNMFDSLGSNEVKMLATQWFFDSNLELIFDSELKDFYTIDSVKAKGAYKKWAKKLSIGMTAHSNAYALQKTQMNDTSTILLWALVFSSSNAHPNYNITHVFFSKLAQNNIIESFLIGEFAASTDPSGSGQISIKGKLMQDGSLNLDEASRENNSDDEMGRITNDHFEYILNNGKLHFKTKSESIIPGKKVKA